MLLPRCEKKTLKLSKNGALAIVVFMYLKKFRRRRGEKNVDVVVAWEKRPTWDADFAKRPGVWMIASLLHLCWLVSIRTSLQRSHREIIILNFGHCRIFIVGYLRYFDNDNGCL